MWKLEVGTVKRLRILNLNLNRLIPDISIEDKARNGNKRDKVVPYPHLHDIRSKKQCVQHCKYIPIVKY